MFAKPAGPTSQNASVGVNSLFGNTTGEYNAGLGYQALFGNTTGDRNAAIGGNAMLNNTDGNDNVAAGDQALFANTTGDRNIALGTNALHALVSLNDNTAVGYGALAKVRGARNIALGKDAGANVSGNRSDNIEIGNKGLGTHSATIRIGTQGTQARAFMAGISGTPIAGPTKAVVVNSAAQLGTATAAEAAPLSAADGRRLLDLIEKQQKQIDVLERQVRRR